MSTWAERYEHASEDTRRQIDRLLEQDADDRAWAEQLGPVYRQPHVAVLLDKSKQAISWLTSPQPSLDGDRPLDRLRLGDVTPVTAATARAARAMAA